jgi:superfamily II DNA or RNA helicase
MPDVLNLKPITGSDANSIGLFLPLERTGITEASFPSPDPAVVGDPAASRILFDAARLLLRSSTAPFRCAGRLSFRPRPYQFMPLILALKLDPIRLLIADDVGVGKTIEAAMIAREMLDRGLIRRMLVLCPAHLCDQWAQELSEKFGLRPAVIQPANFARLGREVPRADVPVYQHYPCMVASIDFVKSERHKPMLVANAPELVIVDEAHLATRPRGTDPQGTAQQQRYELIKALAAKAQRHLVLVTATPHSGIEENFRSLLGLLNPAFDIDPARPDHSPSRQAMLPHIVQRRRADVEKWMGSDTPFPKRDPIDQPYSLSKAYKDLFSDVLKYCRGTLEEASGLRAAQQRVRHWAAIAILRSVLSSPEAAIATLERREKEKKAAPPAQTEESETDAIYRPHVFDDLYSENGVADQPPAAPLDDPSAQWSERDRRRRSEFARKAREIMAAEADHKLLEAVSTVRGLLREGYHPIVFCHFIPTANYVGRELKNRLTDQFAGLRVTAVTGDDPDEVRREKVRALGEHDRRVLVATDCLSEGINLQDHFDAVVHYDLPWNPNRLEQREGRVDRYGQVLKETVKTITIWGRDNDIDQVVLDVLIRKARKIRHDLGIAVPVPADAAQVIEAVVENVLLRRPTGAGKQLELGLAGPGVNRLHQEWDRSADREKENRAYYKHREIDERQVARDLEINDHVLGDPDAVQRFVSEVMQRFGGSLSPAKPGGVYVLDPGDLKGRLNAMGGPKFPERVTFDRALDPDAVYLGRTHPAVEETCHAVLGKAFGREPAPFFARAGAMFSPDVARRTAVVLLRIRYIMREATEEFGEEIVLAAFEQEAAAIRWLTPLADRARQLLDSRSARGVNMPIPERMGHVRWALELLARTSNAFQFVLDERRQMIVESHNRLRGMLKQGKIEVTPHQPDILGCYVLVPAVVR